MTQPVAPRDVIERLERLQSRNDLPDGTRRTARTLASRLSSPVRVTLLGPAGVGKSTLRDVLAGEAVIPAGQRLPTTVLRYGDRGTIQATLGDRTVRTIDGLDFAALRKLNAAYVEVRAPLDRLKDISLLEIVTDGTPGELAAAARWAASRTDIAIWVTADFGPAEQAVWAKVPDEVKDHAYLVLNQVDLLEAHERRLQGARLLAVATQVFRSFFATSAQSATGARAAGEAVSEPGCAALMNALKRHVALASQADLDGALMFLRRYEMRDKTSARATSKPAPVQGAQGNTEDAAAAGPSSSRQILRVEKVTSRAIGQGDAARRDARASALDRLGATAHGIVADWDHLGDDLAETVLDRCVETVEELSGALPPDDQFYEPVLQASDLIVLLQLEQNDAAAENAVTALLQLKREFEVAQAA